MVNWVWYRARDNGQTIEERVTEMQNKKQQMNVEKENLNIIIQRDKIDGGNSWMWEKRKAIECRSVCFLPSTLSPSEIVIEIENNKRVICHSLLLSRKEN